jgi:hypothetical protein
MYQSLIWAGISGDDPGCLRPPIDAENLERLADALVDRVRRDAELGRDFLRAQVLVDEAQAIELAGRQFRKPTGDRIGRGRARSFPIAVRQAVRLPQFSPHLAQHAPLPSIRVWNQP